MIFAPKWLPVFTLIPALLLSACGDKTPDQILTLLEANQLAQAEELAKNALQDTPDDPFYHGVRAEILTKQCVRLNCPATDTQMLTQIREHLQYVKEPVALSNEKTLNFYDRLTPLAERFISIHNDPQSYSEFVSRALPKHAKKGHFLNEINTFAQQAMTQGNLEKAVKLLENVVALGDSETPAVVLSNYVLEFISSGGAPSAELQAKASTVLQQNPEERAGFVMDIPHLALIKARREAENTGKLLDIYINVLRRPFSELRLNKLNNRENKIALANEIYTLSQNEAYIGQFIPQEMDNTIKPEKIKAKLLQIALKHDPKNNKVWRTFFPLALEHMLQGNGSLRDVYGELDLAKIPKEVVIDNNEKLLASARQALQNGEDITFYLQEVIYRRDANQEEVDKQARALLDEALTNAMQNQNYKQAMNYLRLMPEPPEEKVEELKSTLKQALNEFWQNNAFRQMEKATQYMRDKLKASINLDVELMDYLRAYLNSEDVKKRLRATSPAPLLLPAEEAKVDLGPKMDYAKQRFSGRPEIIQARLKSLAINLEGRYSTANVLHSLRHQFTDENLDELITDALKSAMVGDDNLNAGTFAKFGEKFREKWPEFFSVNFVVSESLERIDRVEDAKKVWQNTSSEFHDYAAKLRPQLANLLKGVKLFEQGEQAKAANIFAGITDPVYRREAQPYLEQYGSLVQQFEGSFVYQGENSSSPVAVLFISRGDELLSAEVEAISHLGMMEREENLTTTRGGVARTAIPAKYHTESRQLRFEDINAAIADLSTSEARVFGPLSHLTTQGDTVFLHLQDGTKLPFSKQSNDANFRYLPAGTYGITEEVRGVEPKSYALPVGSILTFSTEGETIRQEIAKAFSEAPVTKTVHPVNGTLRHPAMDEEISLQGFLDAEKNTLHFDYSYTFNNSPTVFNARVRCQPLGNRITCASHNTHEKRNRFMTVVSGRKVQIGIDR